jgi:DNA-directed RNA polymerase subunit L/DNA-directed RNA polymerase alpha subunit
MSLRVTYTVDAKERERAVIGIDGTKPAVMLTMRQHIMHDVKTVAVPGSDGIKSVVNSSRLNTESLAQRIGLIPIHVNDSELAQYGASEWGPYEFKLAAKANNNSRDIVKVTSKDIQVIDVTNVTTVSSRIRDRLFPSCNFSGDHILILELYPGPPSAVPEAIDLTFRARIGCGKDHARWMPVSECYYNPKIDRKRYDEALEAKLNSVQPEARDSVRKEFEVHDGLRQFKVDENGDACSFNFTIYSDAGRSPAKIFVEAQDVILRKTRALHDTLSNHETRNRIVTKTDDDVFILTIDGEKDAFGALIQDRLYHRWIVNENMTVVKFVAFSVPHPLELKIILKWKMTELKDEDDAIATFMDALKNDVTAYIEAFKAAVIDAAGVAYSG